jgi:hypothetical protein
VFAEEKMYYVDESIKKFESAESELTAFDQ